jgi:hypothetical protein
MTGAADPVRSRHRHVDDLSAVVRENDQREEQPEGHRRYDEEVGGHDLTRVIGEKRGMLNYPCLAA